MEWPSIGLRHVRAPPCECIPVQITPSSKTRDNQVVILDKKNKYQREKTHMSFEYVEEHDVLIGKACDQCAAGAVLLRGEFASEQRFASLAWQDTGVICALS